MAVDAGVNVPDSGLATQLRLELRKATDTRQELAVVALPAVVAVLAVVGYAVFAHPATLRQLMIVARAPEAVLLPVVGVRAAASDWGSGTMLHAFIQNSRRHEVLLAKLLVMAVISLGTWLVVLTVTLGLFGALGLAVGQMTPTAVPGTMVAMVLAGVFGATLGAALRSQRWGYAMVALMALTGVPPVVRRLGSISEYVSFPHQLSHLMDGNLGGIAGLPVVLLVWLVLPLVWAAWSWLSRDELD